MEEKIKDAKSKFQFIDNYITECNYKINNRDIKNRKMDVEIEVRFSNIKTEKEKKKAELRMKNYIKIKGDNNESLVDMEVEMAGIFEGENMDDDQFMNYMKYSGAPIISQQIRSYVMTVSTLSGIQTIRLPLVNYSEFFKNAKVKENEG